MNVQAYYLYTQQIIVLKHENSLEKALRSPTFEVSATLRKHWNTFSAEAPSRTPVKLKAIPRTLVARQGKPHLSPFPFSTLSTIHFSA